MEGDIVRPCWSSEREPPQYQRDPTPHGQTMPNFGEYLTRASDAPGACLESLAKPGEPSGAF